MRAICSKTFAPISKFGIQFCWLCSQWSFLDDRQVCTHRESKWGRRRRSSAWEIQGRKRERVEHKWFRALPPPPPFLSLPLSSLHNDLDPTLCHNKIPFCQWMSRIYPGGWKSSLLILPLNDWNLTEYQCENEFNHAFDLVCLFFERFLEQVGSSVNKMGVQWTFRNALVSFALVDMGVKT